MNKHLFLSILILTIICSFFTLIFSGCSDDSSVTLYTATPEPANVEITMENAFGTTGNGTSDPNASRSLLVVISDTHLGDQRSIDNGYGWNIKNRAPLAKFINMLTERPAVKELVIAGDMFDEWVAPMATDTFNGYGSGPEGESKFADSIASANPEVIIAIKNVIASGRKVTYVPGNHDMLLTEADLNRILPGIKQARDADGLGAYTPDWLSEAVIEHSHRYDFYNAPDTISNKAPISPQNYTNDPNAKIPPGFFVTKIATTHGYSNIIPQNDTTGATQDGLFLYWASWQGILWKLDVTEDPNEKIIKTGIDGYTDTYSINDLAPKLTKEPLLYQEIEDNWYKRQSINKVNVPINVASALLTGLWDAWCDYQSSTQYFKHDIGKRIVVFGHTHHATLGYSTNKLGQKCIYANSGTWIDKGDPTGTCVVIDYNSSNKEIITSVYQYNENEKLIKKSQGTITRL